MRLSSLYIAKPLIIKHFESSRQKIFTYTEIEVILKNRRKDWQLSKTLSIPKFIEFLLKETGLSTHSINLPFRPLHFYSWGQPGKSIFSFFEIAMAIRPKGYLSHYSAAYYHKITANNKVNKIYVNEEQPLKTSPMSSLAQDRIDKAFANKVRVSNNKANFEEITFVSLSSKYTNYAGVIKKRLPGLFKPFFVTNLERTLIDVTVRPAYSRGVIEVLRAYRLAAKNVKVDKVIQIAEET